MFIALTVLLIAAIIASVIESRTHERLARKTMPSAPLSICHYCGEPPPHDNTFPLCTACEAAEAEYLTGNHHNV